MLNFRQITLADRPWIQTALRQSDFMGCEYSFANNLAWCRGADSRICAFEGFYLICAFDTPDGTPHFSFPSGTGDLKQVIAAMAGIQLLTDGGGDLVQGCVVHLLYNGHGIFPAVCVSSFCIFSGPAGLLLFCLL